MPSGKMSGTNQMLAWNTMDGQDLSRSPLDESSHQVHVKAPLRTATNRGNDCDYHNSSLSSCHGTSATSQNQMHPLSTLLVDNYDSYTYNLYQLVSEINGRVPKVIRNDEVEWDTLKSWLLDGLFDNIIISPGPGHPEHDGDFGVCPQLLSSIKNGSIPTLPILGVCLGHQGIASCFGYEVAHAPEVMHGRVCPVYHDGKGIFHNIPSPLNVVRYHSLAVKGIRPKEGIMWGTCSSIPNGVSENGHLEGNKEAESNYTGGRESHVAMTEGEAPNESQNSHALRDCCGESGVGKLVASCWSEDGVCMGLEHESLPLYGVQFHPESICTEYGAELMRNFSSLTRTFFGGEGSPLSTNRLAAVNRHDLKQWLGADADHSGAEEEHSAHCEAEGGSSSSSSSNSSSSSSSSSSSNEEECRPNLVVLHRRLPGGGTTPETLFLTTFEKEERFFWLDSSRIAAGLSRFSFLGGCSGPLFTQLNYSCHDKVVTTSTKNDGKWTEERIASPDGFIAYMEHFMTSRRVIRKPNADSNVEVVLQPSTAVSANGQADRSSGHTNVCDVDSLPFDFEGGLVGYIGYEMKNECCKNEKNVHKSPKSDAAMMFSDRTVVYDHEEKEFHILEVVPCGQVEVLAQGVQAQRRLSARPSSWIDEMSEMITRLGVNGGGCGHRTRQEWLASDSAKGSNEVNAPLFTLSQSRESYCNSIRKALDYIHDGESYEVCVTQRIRTQTRPEPTRLYLTLRRINPAPYAAYMRLGGGVHVCCSSPEKFLTVSRTGWVQSKPIKGTRRRGKDAKEDESLRLDLATNVKDRAENLMIVDLVRNDLGRTCCISTVSVPKLMTVETYATVHQLVSTVRGQLSPTDSPFKCVREAFPMGSMTGAPKVRTLRIIDELEVNARGVYSGSIGFFGLGGAVDLNVVIRTAVVDDEGCTIGAGGAIVALSDPQEEYDEMLLKAKALMRAISLSTTPLPHVDDSAQQRLSPDQLVEECAKWGGKYDVLEG